MHPPDRSEAEIPAMDLDSPCPYCGSTNLMTVVCASGPHYARTHCRDCRGGRGRFLRWEPAPMTFERAAAFVLPFGKHAGETIDQVASTRDGCLYLAWLRVQPWLRPTIERALECYRRGVAERRRAAREAASRGDR